jgi:uncharacterized protein (TIGR02145 family)
MFNLIYFAMKKIRTCLQSSIVLSTVFLLSCSEDEQILQPDPPSNLVVEIISVSQLDLSWTDNSNNENGFKVERKTDSEDFSLIFTSDQNTSSYSDNNLSPNLTYTYRVYAFNSGFETGEYSNEASGTTQGVPVLSTTELSSITPFSAVGGGTITLEGGTPIVARGVIWSTSPNPTVELTTKTEDESDIESFTSEIAGLNWEAEYYVRAYATNEVGTGYGEDILFTTEPLVISTTIASGITPFVAASGGVIGGEGGISIIARGIVWSTSADPTIELETRTEDGSGSGSFTSSITGLNWETEYHVRSYATNSAGTTYGDDMTFTTEPIVITTEPVTEIASNSGTSGGTIDGNGGTSILARGLVWSKSPDPTIDIAYKTEDGTGTGNFTGLMTTLVPNTTYYLRAYVSNSATTTYGSQISFITEELADFDGNIYPAVQIGSQVWMAENLKTTKLNDGTEIPNIPSVIEWAGLETPVYDYYMQDQEVNGSIYGPLYNWYTVNTGLVCPTGWHVPSVDEWNSLIQFLGEDVAGNKLRETGTIHWSPPNADATNEFGFTALPGGFRAVEP